MYIVPGFSGSRWRVFLLLAAGAMLLTVMGVDVGLIGADCRRAARSVVCG